jgi:AraC family ethanolamine operon transcriptional activator
MLTMPFIRRSFVDSDEAAASFSNLDVEFAMLAPRERDWVISAARLPGITVFFGQHGAPATATGVTGQTIHSFFVTRSTPDAWSLNGRPLPAHAIGYLAPGSEHIASMRRLTDWLLLHVDVEFLDPLLEAQGHRPAFAGAPVCALEAAPRAFERLTRRIETVLRFAETQPAAFDLGDVRTRLRATLASTLVAALPFEPGREPYRYPQAASRIRAFLASEGDNVVTSAEICLALSTSERTLRRYFNDVFGMSPGRYLRHRRLHLARRSLRRPAHSGASVTDICIALGFFDLGRFAADYREMFGELPSETLRQALGAAPAARG